MRRLGFGLVLLAIAAATTAAEPEYGVVVPGLDLMTVQAVRFDADGLAHPSRYRFTASIVPINPMDTAPFGFGFSNSSYLTPASGRPREIAWATNPEWTRYLGGDRASFSPRLRIESAGQRLEVIPRRHSVWIQWRMTLR